jgi:hypothetical protein
MADYTKPVKVTVRRGLSDITHVCVQTGMDPDGHEVSFSIPNRMASKLAGMIQSASQFEGYSEGELFLTPDGKVTCKESKEIVGQSWDKRLHR